MARKWSEWEKENGGSTSSGASTNTYRGRTPSFSDWIQDNPDAGAEWDARIQRDNEERQRKRQQRLSNALAVKQQQDNIYRYQKSASGVFDEVLNWGRNVRNATPQSTYQLAQQADDMQKYFEENKQSFKPQMLAQVNNILYNGRNTLASIDPSITMNGAERVNYINDLQQQRSRAQHRIWHGSMADDQSKAGLAQEQKSDAEDRLDALRRQNKELKRQSRLQGFEQVQNAPDFETRSQYRSTANGQQQTYGPFGNQSENGFGDLIYDLVNKNQDAIKARYNTVYGASEMEQRLGTDDADLQRMTEDEVNTFNYLYAHDRNQALAYLEDLRPDLRAKQAQYEMSTWSQKTEDNVLTSLESVPLRYIGAMDAATAMTLDKLAGKDLDTNAGYLRNWRISSAIRETGGKMTGEWLADVLGDAVSSYYGDSELKDIVKNRYGHIAEKFGETTYGAVMSALDQLWNLGMSGGNQTMSLVMMASSAVPDTIVSAKERGLSDRDAIGLGIVSGVAEYFTEKVSLEALLDMDSIAKNGFLKYVAKAGLAEGSEEVAADFINFVADEAIAGGKSQFQQAVKEYERGGMSHEEAVKAAWADQVEQSAYSFIGGALAGGGMAVGFGGSNQMYQGRMNRAGAEIKAQNPDNAMIQRMGDAEVARLAIDQQQVAEMERRGALAVQRAVDQIEAGEEIDSAFSDYLLGNANALGVLEEQTGSAEIQNEKDLENALREYANNRDEIENWEGRRMLDDEGNIASVAPDYISNRQALSAAVADDTIQRSFGEEGQKIYKDVANRAVENGMTPTQAYQEISQIYNAGTNRQNIDRATSLPAADVASVFKAGYQDSLKYAKGDEAKVSYASAAGGTGVVTNGLVESLQSDPRMKKQIDTMNGIAQSLGLRVNYVEHLDGANGVYNPKTKEITIAADAEEGATLAWVFGHEMTHRLQQVAPAEYNLLKQSVQNALGSRFNLEVQRELNKALHSGDMAFTQQLAQDEAVANYVGELVRDRGALDKFIDENSKTKEGRSLIQKIRDFFRKLLNKIGIETESLTPIQRTIDALTAALESGSKNVTEYKDKTATEKVVNGLNEDFAKCRYSIAPPYTNGQKAKLAAWVNGMSEEARQYYDTFSAVHDLGMSNLFDGKDITTKFMLASEWNNKISSDKKFKSFAKQLANALPKEMRSSWLDDSGKIIETPFEREFKMQRSFMQRIVDGLPDTVTGTTAVIDGKEIRLADGEKMEGIGGDAYREALYQERVRLFEEGKLPKRKVAGLSKDNWGTLGFLATNQKTGASGDFTTFCPQMYYNKGCFYCYRRAALTSGVNNKLVGQNVWYTGEILQLTDDDVEWLNKKGGLRIQSFGDWMEKYSKQLAEMLSDAEKVGLQIKIITKEPSMIETVARLKDQGLGKSLYFNLSSDYAIERAGSASEYKGGGAMPLNSMRPYMRDEKGDMWWKRALTVEEANEYRKKYPWVNTRIVATTLDEFIRGLKSDMVDVVTGYHGNIREYERISSETGETLVQMEALGDAGMPRFNFDEKSGKWTIEYSGKTKTHKALAQRIQEEGLEYEYYIKSCCITGRCAECKGKCGQLAKDFNIKNATNRDAESVAYWQTHMQSAEDNDLLFSRRDDGMVRDGNKAVMTTERIDYMIEDSAAGSRTDYARWWITSIDPGRFIDLTTRIPMLERDRFDQADYDYMEGLKTSKQTPFLLVEYPSGQIVGHEGRHRMRALEKAGIKSSEISIGFYDEDGYWLKEMNGYGNPLETIDSLQIKNQFETGDGTRIENIIPLNNSTRKEVLASYGEANAGEGAIRYSLREVDPVEPSNDEWSRGPSFAEIKAEFPGLWDTESDDNDAKNPTSVKITEKSYQKYFDYLKSEGFSGTILDASSGLGYGTELGKKYGLNIEDIEPYPQPGGHQPSLGEDYSKVNDTFDFIISNAVLNVIPQDQRDALVVKMGEMLNPGGRMVINVRTPADIKSAKSKVEVPGDHNAWYISSTGSYQKGFSFAELKAYLLDALGEDYTVEKTNFGGGVTVMVYKNGEPVLYSRRASDEDYMKAVKSGDMETAQRMVAEAAKEAGYSTLLYHGTNAFGFTVADPKKLSDRISFFATDSKQVAGTYSGTNVPRNISDGSDSSLGMYQLYANTDGLLELDANGAQSNHIELGRIARDYNDYVNKKSWYSHATTKQIARYAKNNGYPGVVIKNVIDTATPESRTAENASNVYIFFKPKEQVKSADPVVYDDDGNVIPLSERFNSENKDIRYSRKTNSEGDFLTEKQEEYFRNSKVRDENGNLKVMYHGSEQAGFTVFNPKRSDDKISFFFTDNFTNAREYSGTYDDYLPDFKYGFEDVKRSLEEISEEEATLVHNNGKYELWEYYDENTQEILDERIKTKEFDSLKEAQAYIVDEYYTPTEFSANYSVYLNIENPLIVDAEGKNWDQLAAPQEMIDDDWYDEGDTVTTREIAEYAYEVGYDGVIINNIWDNGKYQERQGVESNIAIAFKPDQIKSIYNLEPTHDPDIRYSRMDSDGNELSQQQIEYFKNSKVRDENGNLIVMYHGTLKGGFSIFNPVYSKDGISLFFTDDREVAESYTRGFGETIPDYKKGSYGKTIYPVYLNITNPMIIDAKGNGWNRIQNGEAEVSISERKVLGDFAFTSEADYNSFNEKYDLENLKRAYEEAQEEGTAEYNGEELDEWELEELYNESISDAEKEYRRYYRNNSSSTITAREFFENYEDYGWYELEALQDAYDDNGPTLDEMKESADYDYESAVQSFEEYLNELIEDGELEEGFLDELSFGVIPRAGEEATKNDFHNTRWYAKEASRLGHDGVIIKNVYDRIYGSGLATVAIVFDSNQVKSVDNQNPTENDDILLSRRSNGSMSNLVEMAEANYRNERIKQGYMDAATKWRTDMSALNEYGSSGFSTRMNDLVRSYNPTIGAKEAEKIVGEIRKLTKAMVRDPKMEYAQIEDTANKIAAKIMWGKDGITDNLKYSESAAQAVEDIRNDMMAQILKAQTKGEGKYNRLAKEFDAYKEKANENISEVRRKRDAKIRSMIESRQAEREARKGSKIRTHLLEVMRRLDKASKTADQATKELIQYYIGDYDLVAKSITGKKIDELIELEDYIKEMMEADPNFQPSERALKSIERLHKKRISDIETIEQAYDLTVALLNLEHEMKSYNKLIDSIYNEDIINIGSEIYDEIMDTKGIGNTKTRFGNWFQQSYDSAIARPVLRPETEVLRLVGFNRNSPLYQLMFGAENSLASGQRDMVRYQWEANRTYFDKFLNDREFANSIMGKNAKEYKITGRKGNGQHVQLSVTPDLLMALYMHLQNKQNFRHFGEWIDEEGKTQHGDGITIPDFKLYKAGKLEEAYRIAARDGNKLIIKKSELNAAMNQLTKKEMAFINAAQRYYSEMSQPEVNRVSEKLLGYGLAQVENYFRINTDADYRGANMDAIKRDGTIEGMGNWKERVADARNAILLISLTEQLKRDLDAHSKYVGLAIPVRNFNKAIGVNRTNVDEFGKWMGSEGSVQSAIKGKWGKGAADYLEKLLSDIQNPKSNSEAWNKILGKLRSAYAGSVLALNAGVAIKQAASYPTAAAEIGWKPLIKAFGNSSVKKANRLDMNLINKYSPLMYLRTQGMGYQELADLKNLSKGWLNRALNSKALNWIQDMDVATVKKLWKAAEYYVRDNFKDLEVGSEDYYKKVGEIHSNIIEKTQPNYTTLQRGEILRSDSDLVRMMLGMFKTQPFQNFSILFEAQGELQAAIRANKANPTEQNKAEVTRAWKKWGRAVSSQLVASLVFALMQGLWDWTRGKDDKYKDDEGNLTLGSAMKQVGTNMAANGFGMIPLGNVLYEVIDRIFDKKSSAYGLDASMATGIVNDIQNAAFDLIENMRTVDLDNKNTTEQHIRNYIGMIATAAQAAGYPADNFLKDAQTIAYNMFRSLSATGAMNKYEAEYYAKRIFAPVKSGNKKDYMDLLYRAYDSGDKEAFNNLYKLYINDEGFETDKHTSQENVNSNLAKHIKEIQTEKDRVSVGLTTTDINRYNDALKANDANKDGQYNKDEIYQTLMEIDLTMKQKETLWAENGYVKDGKPQSLSDYDKIVKSKK